MTVDERNLEIIVRSLKSYIADQDGKKEMALKILAGLEKIELVEGDAQIDSDTGQVMTQARRNEIYDKCIAPANELLGINEE